MNPKLLSGIAAAGAFIGGAGVPEQKTWVEMTTAPPTRTFLDVKSVAGGGQARTATVVFVTDGVATTRSLELDCAKGLYRHITDRWESSSSRVKGPWRSDDRENVRRTCEADFNGLSRHSLAELELIVRTQPSEKRWVEVPLGESYLRFLDVKALHSSGDELHVRSMLYFLDKPSIETIEVNCTTREVKRAGVQDAAILVPFACKRNFAGLPLYSARDLRDMESAQISVATQPSGIFVHRATGMVFPLRLDRLRRTGISFAQAGFNTSHVLVSYDAESPGGPITLMVETAPMDMPTGDLEHGHLLCDQQVMLDSTMAVDATARLESKHTRNVVIAGRRYLNIGAAYSKEEKDSRGQVRRVRIRDEALCDLQAKRFVQLRAETPANFHVDRTIDKIIAGRAQIFAGA